MIEADNQQDFIRYAAKHLKEKGIAGWQIQVLQTDPHGAVVSIDY